MGQDLNDDFEIPTHGPELNILLINPNTNQSATELIRNHLLKVTPPYVRFICVTATSGNQTICNERSYAQAEHAAVEAYLHYIERDDALPLDGVLVGCFGDPGVFALRELIEERGNHYPVVGLAEASMRFAIKRGGGGFAIVTGGHPWRNILRRLAKSLDLHPWLTAIQTLDLNGTQLSQDRPAGVKLLTGACKALLDLQPTHSNLSVPTSGAASSSSPLLAPRPSKKPCNSIILGGGLLAGMSGDIDSSELGCHIIDCVTASIKYLYRKIASKESRN